MEIFFIYNILLEYFVAFWDFIINVRKIHHIFL